MTILWHLFHVVLILFMGIYLYLLNWFCIYFFPQNIKQNIFDLQLQHTNVYEKNYITVNHTIYTIKVNHTIYTITVVLCKIVNILLIRCHKNISCASSQWQPLKCTVVHFKLHNSCTKVCMKAELVTYHTKVWNWYHVSKRVLDVRRSWNSAWMHFCV